MKTSVSKAVFIALVAVAIIAIPLNSDIVFGYGSSNNGSSDRGPSTNTTSTPTCDASKPGSAPTLISVRATGSNSIALTWSRAQDPVTQYVVTFGTKPGEQLYGNPNVGNVTSYTVGSLTAGKQYYFKVRGGNNCKPGDFSNELSAVATGGYVAQDTVPSGFEAGVLGKEEMSAVKDEKEEEVVIENEDENQEEVQNEENQESENQPGFFGRIWNFFKGIFGGK